MNKISSLVSLEPDEVHLWHVQTESAIDRGWLSKYKDLMSHDERERYHRFLVAHARDQHLIARAMVRNVLSKYDAIDPADWRFQFDSHGKPRIAEPQNRIDLKFNLAHCHGLVVLAVTQGADIGVDCENMSRDIEHRPFAERYFAPEEVAWIQSTPDDQISDVFFQLWTLKESYIKAVGKGLSLPLDQFGFQVEHPSPPTIRFGEKIDDRSERWEFSQIELQAPFKIAMCVERSANRPRPLKMFPA